MAERVALAIPGTIVLVVNEIAAPPGGVTVTVPASSPVELPVEPPVWPGAVWITMHPPIETWDPPTEDVPETWKKDAPATVSVCAAPPTPGLVDWDTLTPPDLKVVCPVNVEIWSPVIPYWGSAHMPPPACIGRVARLLTTFPATAAMGT